MSPLVSVVVATYNSGAGLDRLVASLDAQSLARDELELVAVDDGSTDDTLDRLHALAASRPWMQVSSVPHSGWPCAPRNAGIQRASGSYVLFADHDDVLYPESLERAAGFAREHRADVLNGKEVRTKRWWWAWNHFTQDVPLHPVGDVAGILPMTPHKLYRRQFLLEHDIRFIEGSRVLWEDVYFNIDAVARGARVATLASYPVYHWVATGENSSSSFSRNQDEYWANVRRVLTHVHGSGLDDGPRDWLLRHWYRTRVLAWVGPALLTRPAETLERGLPLVEGIVSDLLSEPLDDGLGPVDRARSQLLRAHRVDLLRQLAEEDRGLTVVPRLTDAQWQGRQARLRATGRVERAGRPVVLHRDGELLLRRLPREVERAVTPDCLDMTSWTRPQVQLCARGRDSRVPWGLPTESGVETVAAGRGKVRLEVVASAQLDLDRALCGRPLDERLWDIGMRVDLGGPAPHRMLRSAGDPDRLLADGGRVSVLYDNANGLLSLDLDAGSRGLAAVERLVPPQPGGAPGDVVRLDLEATLLSGDARLPVEALVGAHRLRAAVVATEAGAALEVTLPAAPGTERLAVRLAGRTRRSGLWVRVDGDRVELVGQSPDGTGQQPAPPPPPAARRHGASLTPRAARRVVGRVVRRARRLRPR